ncbi:MAG TPA: transporter substrate-binding domain-containing protein [Acidimicrobiales bacterium]|nr:transporter substrate-binding domain-containing protein [Acidimicrobiales bacterium]
MRKLVHMAGAAVALAAGIGWGTGASGAPAGSPSGRSVAATAQRSSTCSTSGLSRLLYHAPDLTVATESPSYPPWFVADDPANGHGFESAMTYALAQRLGIARNRVMWVTVPFDASVTPGPKAFDFDVDQISVTPARARAVSFSRPYYQVDQALVALKGSRIVTRHSPSQLRRYRYGAQAGTTGLASISLTIKPTHPPVSFATLDEAVAALHAHRIDAVVADGPTAQHISPSQKVVIAAQIPTGERYALAFQAHNPLVTCVNRALSALQANGTLIRLQRQFLGRSVSAPTIKP